MEIALNKVVTIDYTLSDDAGNVIDSSAGRGGLTYLHGAGNIITGLESELAGKAVGAEFSVAVAPEEGYGPRDDSLRQVVSREMFDAVDAVEPGMRFHAQSPDGHALVVTVLSVENDKVLIDGNHPLAGVNLNFKVKVLDIRDATQEELEHGHVHGPDGHGHD